MAYQLVAFDLDGTLLSTQRTVSPRNMAALRQLVDRGVHICIATGRTLATAKAVTACLDFPHTLAVYNGALIVDQPSGQELYRNYMQAAQVREVLSYFDHCELHGRRDVFTDTYWHISPYTEAYVAEAQSFRVPSTPLPQVWPDEIAAKAMVTIPRTTSRDVLAQARIDLPDYSVVLSTPTLLEVMCKGVDKGATIAWLAQRLGFSLEHVVAFGDQYNDIEMLQTAGYGVAMGNAIEEAKQVANYVTTHHDDDGVAHVLERLFTLPSYSSLAG